MECYFRRLRLQEFFLGEEEPDEPSHRVFRLPSTWMPPKDRDQTLETYIKALTADTEELLTTAKRRPRDNLTQEERQALTSLHQQTDIVIKSADKESALVIQSRADYIAEAERQLDNTTNQKLDRDPTTEYAKKVRAAVSDMDYQEVIDKWTQRFFSPTTLKPPASTCCPRYTSKKTLVGPSYLPTMPQQRNFPLC